ncbi:MAG: LicD family protein [Oscillospiraceae bacterium]|nr:LicD family protein [Oscillospiraceae bacterium]
MDKTNNTAAKESLQWDETGVVFVLKSLRLTSAAQSMASLMDAFVSEGRSVFLITQSEPSGDDYVSSEYVRRYSVDQHEAFGATPEEAFLKIIGGIPVRTVVFAGELYNKTLPFFQTAQRLGRCTVYAADRPPYAYIGAGAEKLAMDSLYLLKHADCVISTSKADAEQLKKFGAARVACLPFYFPYHEGEVSRATLQGGRIVFFTAFAGRNTRTVLTAFARLHQRRPETTLTLVIPHTVRPSPVLAELIGDIRQASLSGAVKVESAVLKPLRFLRACDVSITYSRPQSMPETVMESICAGIPAIQAFDASGSGDSFPAYTVTAADEIAIERQMEYFLDRGHSEEFAVRARALLEPAARETLAREWSRLLSETLAAQIARTRETNRRFVLLRQSARRSLDEGELPGDIVRGLICDYVPTSHIVAALSACGLGRGEIMQAFRQSDLFGRRDYRKLTQKGWPSAALDLTGVCIDEDQRGAALAESFLIDRGLSEIRVPGADAAQFPEPYNMLTAFKLFAQENAGVFRMKRFRFISRFLAWYTQPFQEHGVLGRLVLFPLRVISRLEKAVAGHGLRRLLRRQIEEVAPEDVRKIQLMVLRIFLEFERVCKKHGLRYYLAGGTILGAVRHNGFIPWDDDMDITMPRPDYDRFLKLAKKELSPEFVLDKDCVPFCHNRIEYKDTRFDTFWRNGGVFLDILALDGSPDDPKARAKHEAKTKRWRFFMLEKARPLPVLNSQWEVQRVFLVRLFARLIPRWFLKWRWNRWAKRYPCDDTSHWVCLPASIYTYDQERFPKEYWGEPVMVAFEGYQFPTMRHWEDYLVCHFGDYKKLPPKTLRKSHHFIYAYDLGKYKNITTEELECEVLHAV